MNQNTVMPDARDSSSVSARDAIVLTCFFVSGFVGLVYEIAWIRKSSLVFGSATFALSTVLAVFFGGWAVGSYLFGGYCRKTHRPLRMYAFLEIGLGVLAFASPAGFALADKAYGLLYPTIAHSFGLLSLARFCLICVLLLPPTVLMGGTLPLMCRQYVARRNRISFGVGFLYGLNTLGAAIGCYTCGFLLIPDLGVNAAIYLGAGLNVLIGVVVLRMRLSVRVPGTPPDPGRDESASDTREGIVESPGGAIFAGDRYFVYALFFVCGFLVLASEILWTRYISLLIHNTVHTYTLTLTIILIGIALGSVATAGFFDRTGRRAFHFGLVQILGGMTVLVLLLLPPEFWHRVLGVAQGDSRLFALVLLLLPPAVLSGVTFPLAIRMVVEAPSLAGAGVGRMTAVNTSGGIFGSLVAGFFALPFLGLHKSLLITTGGSLLIGFSAWAILERRTSPPLKIGLALCAVLGWASIPQITGTRLPAAFLATNGELVDFSEGWSSHLAIIRTRDVLSLEIDRLPQGEDRKSHQIMAAHVPMLLHPDPRDVLVIGLGSGQTGSRFLMYDIERLDCLEIEGKLFDLVRKHYDSLWLDDPRVRTIVEDGRNYTTHSAAKYDVISVEVGQTFRPGVASFYTTEFYHRARERLRTGGLLTQFVPIRFLEPDDLRSVLRTFLDVFPQSILWHNRSELLLIGTTADAFRVPLHRLDLLTSSDRLREDMRFAYWGGAAHWVNQPNVFLGGFLMGPRALGELAGDAPVFRDDLPRLEYATANRRRKLFDTSIIELIRPILEPIAVVLEDELPAPQVYRIEDVQRKNLDNIPAEEYRQVAALRGHVAGDDEIIGLLREAIRWNSSNVLARCQLARRLLKIRHIRQVVEHASAALSTDPRNAEAHFLLARGLDAQGKKRDAVSHYAIAAEEAPGRADVRRHFGAALLAANAPQQAITQLTEALRLKPGDQTARANLALALALLGRNREAIHIYQKLLQADPGNPQMHYNFALMLERTGNLDEAVRYYQQALEIKPDYVLARLNLGQILAKAGAADQAIEQWRMVLRIAPKNTAAHYNLAATFSKAGDFVTAAEHCRHALRARPGVAAVHDLLGTCLLKLGRLDEAVHHYQQALRIEPDFTQARENLQQALEQQSGGKQADQNP